MANLEIEQQSYRTSVARPSPEIFVENNGKLALFVTSWGSPEASQKVIDVMKSYYLSANDGAEVTSPFDFLTCLSPACNRLRIGALLANDILYQHYNKSSYQDGVEVLAFAFHNEELAILQVGQPQVWLESPNLGIIPLTITQDLAMNVGSSLDSSPLPSQLLGVETHSYPNLYSFRISNYDELYIASHSTLATHHWQVPVDQPSGPITFQQRFQAIVRASPQTPFWLAKLRF